LTANSSCGTSLVHSPRVARRAPIRPIYEKKISTQFQKARPFLPVLKIILKNGLAFFEESFKKLYLVTAVGTKTVTASDENQAIRHVADVRIGHPRSLK